MKLTIIRHYAKTSDRAAAERAVRVLLGLPVPASFEPQKWEPGEATVEVVEIKAGHARSVSQETYPAGDERAARVATAAQKVSAT